MARREGRWLRHGVLIGLAALTAGCATFSTDGGFGQTQQVVKQATGHDAVWPQDEAAVADARARVEQLLAAPLTADTAVQVALLANPGLQASYAELRLAEADRVQAGRLPNPLFAFLNSWSGDEFKIERVLGIDVMALLTMRTRTAIGTQRFEAAKLQAAADTVAVAFEARRAFLDAASAEETARYAAQVVDSAEAGRDLAREMAGTGNWSRLALDREQLFYAESVLQLARARQQVLSAREALARALGLWGQQAAVQLPDRLPDLPDVPAEMPDLEQRAMDQRLDVRTAMLALDATARTLGLTKATRLVNVFELGPAQTREGGGPLLTGYELSLDIPIFDWGGARVKRAQAIYTQQMMQLRETAIAARSEVREAYLAYRTAYDVAKHYRDEIVPLRKRISDEQLLRYNGMLISVFELLADARDQVASVNGYLDALQQFWVASANLQEAMVGPVGRAPQRATVAGGEPTTRRAGH